MCAGKSSRTLTPCSPTYELTCQQVCNSYHCKTQLIKKSLPSKSAVTSCQATFGDALGTAQPTGSCAVSPSDAVFVGFLEASEFPVPGGILQHMVKSL